MGEAGAERIAVLRANALGDLIFALPALDALRARYPGAEITLLARPWHEQLLEGRPGPVDRVIAVPPSRGVREEPGERPDEQELDAFFARMRDERFDVAVQLHGGGRFSNPFVRRLGAALTAGCRTEDAPPLHRWIPYVYFQSEIARCLEVAGLVDAPPTTLAPSLAVVPRDLDEAAELADAGAYAVLHPGAGATRRRWAAPNFAVVGDALAAEGLRVVVTGTGAERPIVEQVVAEMASPALAACDALSLGGLAGLLSRAAIMVSNDSGPLHLAAAVGAPAVGIFWIGNLINAAPLTRAAHRPVASFRVRCPVCGQRNVEERCAHEASFVDDVPVADVVAAARDLLARPAVAAPDAAAR
jgi:ADP-heptose:LPS heptosyltransferase